MSNPGAHISVIFGRPFLNTIDATIKIRSGIMTIVFGNMTLNVKIFSNPRPEEYDDEEEIHYIDTVIEDEVDLVDFKDPLEVVMTQFGDIY